MALDKELRLASSQSTGTLAAATKLVTTNGIDLWANKSATGTPATGANALSLDIGKGRVVYAVFTINTILDMANAAGTFRFSVGDTSDMSSAGNALTNYLPKAASKEFVEADGATTLRVVIPIKGAVFAQRYLVGALENTGGTHAFVSGAFSCEIYYDVPDYQA